MKIVLRYKDIRNKKKINIHDTIVKTTATHGSEIW